jgi:hypothetical protein
MGRPRSWNVYRNYCVRVMVGWECGLIVFAFLRVGRSGDRIPVGRDFPHPSRPAVGPPSLLYNEYRVFPGGKAAGAWPWPHPPHIAPRLKKEYSYLYTSTPPLGLRGLLQGERVTLYGCLVQATMFRVRSVGLHCTHLWRLTYRVCRMDIAPRFLGCPVGSVVTIPTTLSRRPVARPGHVIKYRTSFLSVILY